MLYKIEGKSADGKRWIRLFDGHNEPYTPIKNELTRHGYSHATQYPPQPMEFWMSAQTGFESMPQTWETCWYCKGERFIAMSNKRHMACPVCHLDGCTMVGPTEKKLDKLIEGLNL